MIKRRWGKKGFFGMIITLNLIFKSQKKYNKYMNAFYLHD